MARSSEADQKEECELEEMERAVRSDFAQRVFLPFRPSGAERSQEERAEEDVSENTFKKKTPPLLLTHVLKTGGVKILDLIYRFLQFKTSKCVPEWLPRGQSDSGARMEDCGCRALACPDRRRGGLRPS